MLRLNSKPINAIPVPLPGNAVWRIRPATEFQIDAAVAEATFMLAAVVAAGDALESAVALLGEEFRAADFRDEKWIKAASERIALIALAEVCTESWSGFEWAVTDDDGNVVEVTEVTAPERAHIAVALRDPTISALIKRALHSGVHEVIAEKNGLAASPSGGAATDVTSAPDVPSRTTAPASADSDAPKTDGAAPSTNIAP